MAGIISLTTDFGLQDEYVGVMKGVIYNHAPGTHIIDLTHSIPCQDIGWASFIIYCSYKYLPAGSIHVLVVDPGVGSSRRIILLNTENHLFLAPDNGLLTMILLHAKIKAAYEVTNRSLFLPHVGRTFHGRDILAPVAARLAMGLPHENVGPACDIEKLVRLDLAKPSFDKKDAVITGEVIHIDHFGNLTTNIHRDLLHDLQKMHHAKNVFISLAGKKIEGLRNFYDDATPGKPLAIIGSRNFLEVSVNRGNAAIFFNAEVTDTLLVSFNSAN